MYKVGLTGGIGSGKSTVAKIFETLRVPIYYADERAKGLMLREDIKSQIISNFGENSYTQTGELDRAHLAKIVFNDTLKLRKLNSIVHPALGLDFLSWANEQNSPYVIEEAAILIESKGFRVMDKIIVVSTALETRIERVVRRDKMPRASVEARIAAQMTDQQRLTYADYIITADEEKSLLPQIVKIDEEIKKIVVSLSTKIK